MTIINKPILKRTVIAWAMYDWANAVFGTIVTTFIFAAYFTRKIAANPIIGTKQWGYAIALAAAMIVILSPVFGAIADHGGRRKPWLAIFTLLTITGASLLWFAQPNANYIYYTLACVIIGTIGFEISQVFYNALLPSIASPQYLGRISGWGWGCGYAGGLVALSIALFAFVKAEPSWLNTSTAENIRICGPFTALWIAIFAIPLFAMVPDYPATGLSTTQAISRGLSTLINTLRTLPQQKNIFRFLIARMIYLDGLNTIFAFGGVYAAGTFGMSISEVIEFGIVMNIAAGSGAAGFAWIDDLIGAKKTIYLSLLGLLFFGACIVLVKIKLWFWIFAFALSIFVGPIQAASRSLMVRLSPPDKITEMFGLYAFSGKATAFIGPWLLGTITYLFNSQRVGVATILIFFVIGGIILARVKEAS